MKNRASLVLMEQLVMILVFSLAAAACLHIFVRSAETSYDLRARGKAVVLCQNAAEIVKANGGLEEAKTELGAEKQGDIWIVPHDRIHRMELQPLESSVPGLAQAEIRFLAGEEELFSLVTGWQEELP